MLLSFLLPVLSLSAVIFLYVPALALDPGAPRRYILLYMGHFSKILEDSLKDNSRVRQDGEPGVIDIADIDDVLPDDKSFDLLKDKIKAALKTHSGKNSIMTPVSGVTSDFTNMQPGFAAGRLGYSVQGNL